MSLIAILNILNSNIRLLDCINKASDVVKKAINIGLSGIAFTEHDCLSGAVKLNKLQKEISEENPDFKIAIGNEIYLCETRDKGQKYNHFILIAKNENGFRALRELSSRAWMNSFMDRGMERVVTTYDDLQEVLNKYPNSLIGTTACLGGELSIHTMNLINAENHGLDDEKQEAHNNIIRFVLMCKEMFGDDFYIECAPGASKQQITVNIRLQSIAACFGVKMVIGCDAHYLGKEDRYVHKAYLNSKGGEREVDDFYEYAYLQTEDEIKENLKPSILDQYEIMCENSMEIYNKIENYSILHSQNIPKVEVKGYPKSEFDQYPILDSMLKSDDKIERYWVNECLNQLRKIDKFNDTYLDRLEEEAQTKRIIGGKLDTNMFAYPVTLQHYVNLIWECGSTIGAGRGSSCAGLNHYLLGVTQLDPIEWNFPWFRYMNEDRLEIADIDIDISPSKRPIILQRIREERGSKFNSDVDELSRQNLGCTLVATFGTESTKSAILTSCRGYRSADCPDGIDPDTAQYLSSLVPVERGMVWSFNDVIYGDEDKGRKPVHSFINEIEKYPGLKEIMIGIEGLIKSRGSHASGVIFFDEDPYEFGCFMRTSSGDIITQYDLHDAEAVGLVKYDFLVTEVQDKITQTIKFLQEDERIPSNLSFREVYERYLHPKVLPLKDKDIWKNIQEAAVLDLFQFDSDVGRQGTKKTKPTSIQELSDTNGLIRLAAPTKGAETPLNKYVRFKNDISQWKKEMFNYGLTPQEQLDIQPYFAQSYGVPPSQEQLMLMLMDENICGFTLAEANDARKIVGKKQIKRIPELKMKVLKQAKSDALGEYIWDCGIGPQMTYSFSIIHATAYSFIGFQTAYLATKFPSIYWNTACLVVNSASLEDGEGSKSTDYTKTAKALSDSISRGIKVSLVDINKSDYSFKPDVENNQILFGMKALSRVNGETIEKIKAGRPYTGIGDFMNRCPLNKLIMVTLIKSGAFDTLDAGWASAINPEPRIGIMAYYISQISEPKKKLNLTNFNTLINKGLIPDELSLQKTVFLFNKYLKSFKRNSYYVFTDSAYSFYTKYYSQDNLEVIDGVPCINQKTWDKIYQSEMDVVREWIKNNQEITLQSLNDILFKECWEKYCKGNISSWEMEALCFYYHEHELEYVDDYKYGLVDYNELDPEPVVSYTFNRNNREIPIFELYKIIGTVLSKNDTKSTVSILTTTGVVNVKFTKEYYANYNRQLSKVNEDGTKSVVDKSWFTRGVKVMITGYRREDFFVAKTYTRTPTHQLYKITEILPNGDMVLVHDRVSTGEDDGEFIE